MKKVGISDQKNLMEFCGENPEKIAEIFLLEYSGHLTESYL
jgi:hypothetical protein